MPRKSTTAPADVANLLKEYDLGEILGQGAFGVVYECGIKGEKNEKGQKRFDLAVKMVDKVETPKEDIDREVKMQMELQHPNVVACKAVFDEKFFICIVMERYRGGDVIEGMQNHWKTKGKIPIACIPHILAQMATAIAHLHSKNVVHRDVKGDNFLMDRKSVVDPNVRIVMSDFGTATEMPPAGVLKSRVGTKFYWSPEFWAGNYGLKVDVWAMGVIFFGLIQGKFPFKNQDDAKRKEISLTRDVPPECSKLLHGCLHKDAPKRLSSKQVRDDVYLKNETLVNEQQDTGTGSVDFDIKETGANAAVVGRRKELVDRLLRKGQGSSQRQFTTDASTNAFSVTDKTGKTFTYEWCAKKRVDELNLISRQQHRAATDDTGVDLSKQTIRSMLEEHNVDYKKWGTGVSKSFDSFASEVMSGAATLMLKADSHKKLVRVVDVVLLRVSCPAPARRPWLSPFGLFDIWLPDWCCDMGQHVDGRLEKFLIETKETFADARARSDLDRLPGSKREAGENVRQVAKRMADSMEKGGMGIKVHLNFERPEAFEEEEESLSFPGMHTVYRKTVIEGRVAREDSGQIWRWFFGAEPDREISLGGTAQFYAWLSEDTCKERDIKLRAPKEADVISSLVYAPVGMGKDDLEELLVKKKIDTTKFGTGDCKTLEAFSDELLQGEASIMTQPDGSIVRVVDVVLLWLTKDGDKDNILIQTSETCPNGPKTERIILPGVKRRPDEHQFMAAHRCLRDHLHLDENEVTLDVKNVNVVEETKESVHYPGIQTLYHKRVIYGSLRQHS